MLAIMSSKSNQVPPAGLQQTGPHLDGNQKDSLSVLAPALHPSKRNFTVLPGDLPHPGIEPRSPALQADVFLFLPLAPPGKPRYWIYKRAIASAPDTLGVESTLKAIGLRVHGRVMAHIWSCDASVTDSIFHVFVARDTLHALSVSCEYRRTAATF